MVELLLEPASDDRQHSSRAELEPQALGGVSVIYWIGCHLRTAQAWADPGVVAWSVSRIR